MATDSVQMATLVQFIAAILIKVVIKCIERDGNDESSFIRDENVIEIV